MCVEKRPPLLRHCALSACMPWSPSSSPSATRYQRPTLVMIIRLAAGPTARSAVEFFFPCFFPVGYSLAEYLESCPIRNTATTVTSPRYTLPCHLAPCPPNCNHQPRPLPQTSNKHSIPSPKRKTLHTSKFHDIPIPTATLHP